MVATIERSEVRISVRVDSDLLDRVQRVADDRFEGRLSMAAREAFRRLVADEILPVIEEGERAA